MNYDGENTVGRGPGARTVVFIGKQYLLTMSSATSVNDPGMCKGVNYSYCSCGFVI